MPSRNLCQRKSLWLFSGRRLGQATTCKEIAITVEHAAAFLPDVAKAWLLPRVDIEAAASLREAQQERALRIQAMWHDMPSSERDIWKG